MQVLLNGLILLIALLHLGFMWLEMVLWSRPAGRKIFHMNAQHAEATRRLAANQGLYNGFLAAGLLWGLIGGATEIQLFFLACVLIAGVYGALSVSRAIFWVQAFPALLALLVFSLHHYS